MAHTIDDAVFLIRDWTRWSGCSAWKGIAGMADDAHKIAAYAEARPSSHVNRFSGERDGDPENAAKARKAEKQYRLAAWVLKRIYEGREEYDARVKAAEEAAEETRIAALPRVDSRGRPIGV
jgi:hypothetical protein